MHSQDKPFFIIFAANLSGSYMGKFKLGGVALAMISSASFGFIPLFSKPLLASGVRLESVCLYRFILGSFFLGCFLFVRSLLDANKKATSQIIIESSEKAFKPKETFGHKCTEPSLWKVMKECFGISWKELWHVLIVSIFYGGTAIFLTASYNYLESGLGTTIHFLYPVFIALIMAIGFKEKLNWRMTIAIGMAILGVACLSGAVRGGYSLNTTGFILVMIATICYPIYIVSVNVSSTLMAIKGGKLSFYVLLCASLLFLINVFAQGNGFSSIRGWDLWFNVIMLALVPTLIANFTLIYAIKSVGSTVTSILGCMEPLTAVLVGVFYFREQISGFQYLGIAIILVAVMVVLHASSEK